MGHLEGNFTPVLYIGRKVPKGLADISVNVSVNASLTDRRQTTVITAGGSAPG